MENIIILLEKFGFPVFTTLTCFYFIYWLLGKFAGTINELNDTFHKLNLTIVGFSVNLEETKVQNITHMKEVIDSLEELKKGQIEIKEILKNVKKSSYNY